MTASPGLDFEDLGGYAAGDGNASCALRVDGKRAEEGAEAGGLVPAGAVVFNPAG